MKHFKWAFALLVVLLAGCTGVDPIRHRAERDSHALAVNCAEGWFTGQPVPGPEAQRLVRNALADWGTRLDSDAKLLPGGLK